MRIVTSFNQPRVQFGGGYAMPVFRGHRQYGGDIAVFRGAREYQYGRGFGDVLKSIGRFAAPLLKKALPVVLKTGKKLVKHVIQNRESGQSWGQSFREAAPYAGYSVLKEMTPAEQEAQNKNVSETQTGKGCRRRQFGGRSDLIRRRVYKRQRLIDVDIDGRRTHYNF
jgi:hypothetical protein